jgi:RNA polymerase sigma factor (sigma-70 family)
MATGLHKVLEHIQRVLAPPDEGLSDGQLLARFVAARDEASFAALVRRHGPMVLGVCRRMLGHAQDAEDCFQVAFLVLARKASSVVKRESVGSFLYGVAYRTALTARTVNRRRQARERQVEVMPHPEVTPVDVPDWRPWLDRELSRLPEKYRTPVILCDLEGRTRKEVARHLGLPEGTLSSRLATARRMLAKRLSRHELPLAGGVLALSLSGAATAGVPESLVASTTKAAILVAVGKTAAAGIVSATVAAWTEGVLQTMFVTKVKTAAVVLVGVAALGLGTGGLMYQTRAGAADSAQPTRRAIANRPSEAAPERDDGRLVAEEAKAREQALREALEEARREAEKQRERAEAERKRADEAVLALKEQLEAARREVELARNGNAVRASEGEFNKQAGPTRRGESAAQRTALAEIELMAARLNEQFDQQRRALQEQLAKLDEQHKQQLADLERQAEKLRREVASQPKSEGGLAPAGADKLDQLLQRLERIEKRLDRLERRKE